MHRPILTCAILALTTAAFAQQQQPSEQPTQQSSSPDPYQGQSVPPPDDVIVATQPDQPRAPKAKPHAGKPQTPNQAQQQAQPPAPAAAVAPAPAPNPPADASTMPPSSVDPSANYPDPAVTGTDDGIVGIAKPQPAAQPQQPQPYSVAPADTQPALMTRGAAADPDGDIVHPNPLQPGQVAYGTTIRVRLLTPLSSNKTQQGDVFRTRVASDVVQDGQVLIPAGAEIDGRVAQVSAGTTRSHGSILLRPDYVIMSDGSRFRLEAQVTGTPGSKTRVNHEGFIDPPSRLKKDAILYGAAVGGGAGVGAVLGGGVGAVTGAAIGAGVITLHILSSHSETNLEPGTVLLLTLNNRLDLQAAAPQANPTGN